MDLRFVESAVRIIRDTDLESRMVRTEAKNFLTLRFVSGFAPRVLRPAMGKRLEVGAPLPVECGSLLPLCGCLSRNSGSKLPHSRRPFPGKQSKNTRQSAFLARPFAPPRFHMR